MWDPYKKNQKKKPRKKKMYQHIIQLLPSGYIHTCLIQYNTKFKCNLKGILKVKGVW